MPGGLSSGFGRRPFRFVMFGFLRALMSGMRSERFHPTLDFGRR
jgi:hypothetical protein